MIFISYTDEEKLDAISSYITKHDIEKVVLISGQKRHLPLPECDRVWYKDVIMYVTFYRLLQEITPQTLLVIDECLRTQNRYDLSYNCIRNYLNLTNHQLIFQQLPQIDDQEDFMILFDFDTRSRWKRRQFDPYLIGQEAQVFVHPLAIQFERISCPTSAATKAKYARERDKLFRELGSRDPHIIPRNLYLIGGMDKRAYIDSQTLPLFDNGSRLYVARNKRLRRDCIVTYNDATPGATYDIVEFPHRFIDFTDFIWRTGQTASNVLVADLKVDHWYYSRYQEWAKRIHETYASLSQ